MSAKAQWLLQLPEILRQLEALPSPVLDRAAIERLFGVGRRRAIQLMGLFGGYQIGRTFVLERSKVLAALRSRVEDQEFRQERRRKARVAEALDELYRVQAAKAVVLPVQPGLKVGPGVVLEPGRLEIRFDTAEELLARLFELAQAVSRDFERFREVVESPGR
ncbi:MAG: hypothetical protein FJW40_08290 [Acidobacteria bacterium]|nr:hypothetical protein [Acidobacteriota bacterium]